MDADPNEDAHHQDHDHNRNRDRDNDEDDDNETATTTMITTSATVAAAAAMVSDYFFGFCNLAYRFCNLAATASMQQQQHILPTRAIANDRKTNVNDHIPRLLILLLLGSTLNP